MLSNGISKLDLKRQNRMQILRLLRRNGPTSRIDIAREIGITKAAVTIITNEMIEDGILYEKGEQPVQNAKISRGRKKILLDIYATYKMDLGMVLEGNVLHAGVATLWGDIVERQSIPLSMDVSSEELLVLMENLYQKLVYKNDLSPEEITGLGVCIDPRYFKLLHIGPASNPDYSLLEEKMSQFVKVPMVFGTLNEGAAMAELEYWQKDGATAANEMLLFRCTGRFGAAAIIGQELYRGSHGQALCLGETTEKPAERILLEQLQAVYSEMDTPELWRVTGGKASEIWPAFIGGHVRMVDEPVRRYTEAYLNGRIDKIRTTAELFDPSRLILLSVKDEDIWMTKLLTERLQGHLPVCQVSVSPMRTNTLVLAGAAMADREFFCNRGGY